MRYRLSGPVQFGYRGDEVAAQAATGAVRYDITCDPARGRWYIDASWKVPPVPAASLDDLRQHPAVAIDVNHGHLAAAVVAADGNILGAPATIPLDLAGLPAATRDGHLRAAITSIIATVRQRLTLRTRQPVQVVRSGLHSCCNPANANSISDWTPVAWTTRQPDACPAT